MYYRRQEQPGCGGCLLIVLLFIFLSGGAPSLINFMGWLIFSGISGILLLMALFWGFTFWARRQVASYEQSQSESHNRFVWLLVQILMHIARMDGEVTRDEVQTIQRFFQQNLRYSQTQMMWVKELIKEATTSTISLEELLMEFKSNFAYEPRLILLELVYQVLYTKSNVSANELQTARNIASYLDISSFDQSTIEARYQYRKRQAAARTVDRATQYYAVLGLTPGASKDEVKKAYRKLSMQYHPDKVRHLGDEFRKVAEEKMKEINIAYDFLSKQ